MNDYKPITCPHCDAQLALARPDRLLFNQGSYCDEPVPLRCSRCGARRFWKPVQTIDESVTVCYATAVPA
jgi:DNA-directed RNA polymerase subunit RPC12/RpoP